MDIGRKPPPMHEMNKMMAKLWRTDDFRFLLIDPVNKRSKRFWERSRGYSR